MASAVQGAQPKPLAGFALGLTAFALALGTLMQVLDTTIANVSLPTIAGNLGVSNDNSTWVITAFAVSNGATVPLTGWLMGRFGVVRTFCFSVGAFTVASLLCGIAWDLNSLIVFRVLQGAVSGPMIPGSQALLISIFPPQKRATALGIWSITAMLGPIMGPVLGGYISDNYHWAWIFLINVPVGIFCFAVCWRSMIKRDTATRKLPIDRIGLILLFIWVGALQIMLDLGKDADWFHATRIVVMALIAVVIFIAWIIWEMTDRHPVVDLSLFRNRSFMLGTLSFCLAYAVFFANSLLLPLWLQTNMGYTATWAGLVSAPSGIVAVILTPFVTRISSKVDARILATVGMLAYAGAYWLRSDYTTTISLYDVILPMVVQGVAMSVFFLSMVSILLDGIPPEKIPSATGISNFCRITGGSFAASIITTMWDRRETLHQSRLSEAVGNGPQLQSTIAMMHAHGMTDRQAVGAIGQQLTAQSYLLATTDLFRVSSILCALLVITVWLVRKPKPPAGPIAAD